MIRYVVDVCPSLWIEDNEYVEIVAKCSCLETRCPLSLLWVWGVEVGWRGGGMKTGEKQDALVERDINEETKFTSRAFVKVELAIVKGAQPGGQQ